MYLHNQGKLSLGMGQILKDAGWSTDYYEISKIFKIVKKNPP